MEEMKVMFKEIVAGRLSAAPESAAKAELIEELAENLVCRYADLMAAGEEPEEARARAVDALGDTDELVEYLRSLEPDQPLPQLVLDPDKTDGGQLEEILHNVEDILRGAFQKAKTTFRDAKEVVKEGFDNAASKVDEDSVEQLRSALEEKEQQLEEAREALEQLETVRDALEDVSDQSAVAGALAEIEIKIGAKEAEIEALEAEVEALEEACDTAEEAVDEAEEAEEDGEEGSSEGKGWKVSFHGSSREFELDSEEFKSSMKDAMKDIERVIREATGAAKDACKTAWSAAEKACEDAVTACTPDTAVEPGEPIDADQLKAIDVQTFGGDITIRMTQPADGDVLVGGDSEALEVFRSADGVLTIRPVKTETSVFFLGRGIFNSGSSADVVLDLPCRDWAALKITTTGGDVALTGSCPVDQLSIATVSGDVRVGLPTCGRVMCKTTNGDIRWNGDVSDLRLESISGDVEFRGSADSVTAKTTSGDLTLEGGICAAGIKTISGDVSLRSSVLPGQLDLGTTSGDMWVDLPDQGPFTARFRSTSGDFTSDFFTGRMGGRNCVFTYQGGGERTYTFASVSGDVELRKFH